MLEVGSRAVGILLVGTNGTVAFDAPHFALSIFKRFVDVNDLPKAPVPNLAFQHHDCPPSSTSFES
jgi:hypothetical protein